MFIVIFIITLSGCVIAPGKPKHDTLVIAIDLSINLISLLSWDLPYGSYPSVVGEQILGYLGMLAPGETVYTMPGLAENWTTNSDRTSWTFTLRDGLKFHDGSKITAEDIEYSFKAAAAYTTAFADYLHIDNITDPAFEQNYFNFTYDSPESLTFTISSTTRFPDPVFEWDFSGIWFILAIVPKNCYDTNSSQEAFRKKPIYAGPYMIASENDSIPGESLLLTRFDDWYGWGQTFTASNGRTYVFSTVEKAYKFIEFQHVYDSEIKVIELEKKSLT